MKRMKRTNMKQNLLNPLTILVSLRGAVSRITDQPAQRQAVAKVTDLCALLGLPRRCCRLHHGQRRGRHSWHRRYRRRPVNGGQDPRRQRQQRGHLLCLLLQQQRRDGHRRRELAGRSSHAFAVGATDF